MAEINKKYDVEIEVLTPLSIGAGAEKDWVRGVDFVVKDRNLYKLNLKKIAANGVDLAKLSNFFASKNEKGVLELIDDKLNSVSDFCKPFPTDSKNDIKSFVKNQLSGNPVLTGSSIKGAIRSILLDYLATKSEIEDAKRRSDRERKPFESYIFGSSKDGDEFMRFIKFSDAEFDKTELVNTKIFNLHGNGSWKGGWKDRMSDRQGNSYTNETYSCTGFNTIYESLMPNQKNDATIMLSLSLFDLFERNVKSHIKSGNKRPILANGITKFFSIINNHTKEYLQKEKSFFEKYSTDKTDNIIASIDALLEKIPNDNSYCILKMSAGSGFHSITGDWQFEDYFSGTLDRKRNQNAKPKSRKIAIQGDVFSLMGFVKLRPITEAEKQAKEKERQKKLQRILQEQEEQKQIALEIEKQRAEEQQKKANYAAAIKTAEAYRANNEFEKALIEYEKAAAILPEGKQHETSISDLKTKLELIRKQKEAEAERIKREQEETARRQQKIEGGLIFLDEKYEFGPNEGQYKVKNFPVTKSKIDDWLKKSQNQTIPDEQIEILQRTLSRIYATLIKERDKKLWTDFNSNIWQTVKNWTSDEIATQWFNEICK